MREQPVILLVGPTAVGKTELSIGLAKRVGAEIVSVDSRLLYRGMDIGTAKPSNSQRKQVNHHLIDVAEASERWSLTRFLAAAKKAIAEIHTIGKLPLLVGGTGQYVAAIVEGWQPPPKADDPNFRKGLMRFVESKGESALHAQLEEVDPVSAERIDARNVRRVIRALEIHHVTGQAPSEQRKKEAPPSSFLILGLTRPREELYSLIDERIEAMLAAGWVEEVAELVEQGFDFEKPALSAIGYRQIAEHLRGECDLEVAVKETSRLTRQFVRRQANWFRRLGSDVHWFEADEVELNAIGELVQRWLDD